MYGSFFSKKLPFCCAVTKSFPTLRPCGLQHARFLDPSLSPRVCSNSCPLSQWCYLTISSSATLFSFCLQSFPASGSFPMSWLFASGGQSIRPSASASVLPMKIHGWFPLGLTGLISLQSKGLSRVFSSIIIQKDQFFGPQPSLIKVQLSHWYMTTGKTGNLSLQTQVGKVMSLLFNTLSSKHMNHMSITTIWASNYIPGQLCQRSEDLCSPKTPQTNAPSSFIHKSQNLEATQMPLCCSVTKLCPTLCNPMNCSKPGFPALHYCSLEEKLWQT